MKKSQIPVALNILKTIYKISNRDLRAKLAATIILVLISSILELASITAIVLILGSMLTSSNTESNITSFLPSPFNELAVPALLFALIPLALLLRLKTLRAGSLIGASIGSLASQKILEAKVTRLNFEKFTTQKKSEILNLLANDIDIFAMASTQIIQTISAASVSLVLILSAIAYDPALSAILIGLIIAFYLFQIRVSSTYFSTRSTLIRALSEFRLNWINNVFIGYRELKITSSLSRLESVYLSKDSDLRRYIAINQYQSLQPRLIVETLLILSLISYVIVNIMIGSDKAAILKSLAFIALVAQRSLPTFQQLYTAWSYTQRFASSINVVLNTMLSSSHIALPAQKKLLPLGNMPICQIICRNISYRYPSATNFTMKNLSFTAELGDLVAITGRSGTGKSTLADLIMGLISPSEGTLILRCDDAAECLSNTCDWSTQISYSSQNPVIYNTSLRENIAAYKNNLTDAQIDNAMFYSCLYCSSKSPLDHESHISYDYPCGEDGCNLSGGQKQRLSIARAFTRSHRILILDESTNGLDKEVKQLFLSRLLTLKRDRIIFFLTHDPDVIDVCTKSINLDSVN